MGPLSLFANLPSVGLGRKEKMIADIFKKITGCDPYPHQIETYEPLANQIPVFL